jgi:Holliday junction resolvasome RuvABC endonuclease subunit
MDGEPGTKPQLVFHGTIDIDKSLHEFGKYPDCYRKAARHMAALIHFNVTNIDKFEVIVIEEINLGRNRYTQKLLENIHTAMLDQIESFWPHAKVVYLDSSEWRHNLGLKMTKEQKKLNAKLSKAKKLAAQTNIKLDKKKLGIKGKVNAKHLAVAHANTIFGLQLKMKQNDAADAICIGLAFFNGATPCDGVQ